MVVGVTVIERAPVRLGASSFAQTSHGLWENQPCRAAFSDQWLIWAVKLSLRARKGLKLQSEVPSRGSPEAGETLSSPENFVTWAMAARSCLQGGPGSALEIRSGLVWSFSHTRTVTGLPEADVRYKIKTSPEKSFILSLFLWLTLCQALVWGMSLWISLRRKNSQASVEAEEDDKGTCKLQKVYSPDKFFIWAVGWVLCLNEKPWTPVASAGVELVTFLPFLLPKQVMITKLFMLG